MFIRLLPASMAGLLVLGTTILAQPLRVPAQAALKSLSQEGDSANL